MIKGKPLVQAQNAPPAVAPTISLMMYSCSAVGVRRGVICSASQNALLAAQIAS